MKRIAMSLRHEQYNALKRTREFLYDIMSPGTRPKTVKEFKVRASSCLKHFPALKENGEPMFSHDGLAYHVSALGEPRRTDQ